MADRTLLLIEGFIRIYLQLDGLRVVNFLDGIVVVVVVLAIGVVLGYAYANYANKSRIVAMMEARRTVGTQSQSVMRRSIGAQSHCTYKWWYVTPRFQVLHRMADGVVDLSYASPIDMDSRKYKNRPRSMAVSVKRHWLPSKSNQPSAWRL